MGRPNARKQIRLVNRTISPATAVEGVDHHEVTSSEMPERPLTPRPGSGNSATQMDQSGRHPSHT